MGRQASAWRGQKNSGSFRELTKSREMIEKGKLNVSALDALCNPWQRLEERRGNGHGNNVTSQADVSDERSSLRVRRIANLDTKKTRGLRELTGQARGQQGLGTGVGDTAHLPRRFAATAYG
jgi:hypothetical protein